MEEYKNNLLQYLLDEYNFLNDTKCIDSLTNDYELSLNKTYLYICNKIIL